MWQVILTVDFLRFSFLHVANTALCFYVIEKHSCVVLNQKVCVCVHVSLVCVYVTAPRGGKNNDSVLAVSGILFRPV